MNSWKPKPRKTKEEMKEFRNACYLTCGYCGYNNERYRLQFFKVCLKCGKSLGDEKTFKRELKKRMDKLK